MQFSDLKVFSKLLIKLLQMFLFYRLLQIFDNICTILDLYSISPHNSMYDVELSAT